MQENRYLSRRIVSNRNDGLKIKIVGFPLTRNYVADFHTVDDCGVFCILYAMFVAKGLPPVEFSVDEIIKFRKKICFELLEERWIDVMNLESEDESDSPDAMGDLNGVGKVTPEKR